MGRPITFTDTMSRHPKPYLVGSDMAFLERVLEDCAGDLENAGVINRADRDYEAIRLRLAAAILGHAVLGEADPVKLKECALQALDPYAPERIGVST